jgi:hypothetical protein
LACEHSREGKRAWGIAALARMGAALRRLFNFTLKLRAAEAEINDFECFKTAFII